MMGASATGRIESAPADFRRRAAADRGPRWGLATARPAAASQGQSTGAESHRPPRPFSGRIATMIKGQKIYLTELDWDNSETIRAWLNDPEVHKYLGTRPHPDQQRGRAAVLRIARGVLGYSQLRDPRGRGRPLHRQCRAQGHRPGPSAGRTGDHHRPQRGLGEGLRLRRYRHLPALRFRHSRAPHGEDPGPRGPHPRPGPLPPGRLRGRGQGAGDRVPAWPLCRLSSCST